MADGTPLHQLKCTCIAIISQPDLPIVVQRHTVAPRASLDTSLVASLAVRLFGAEDVTMMGTIKR
jgi:hypothetical protein